MMILIMSIPMSRGTRTKEGVSNMNNLRGSSVRACGKCGYVGLEIESHKCTHRDAVKTQKLEKRIKKLALNRVNGREH